MRERQKMHAQKSVEGSRRRRWLDRAQWKGMWVLGKLKTVVSYREPGDTSYVTYYHSMAMRKSELAAPSSAKECVTSPLSIGQ